MQRPAYVLVAYLVMMVAFVTLDAAWLWLVAGDLFRFHVGTLLSEKPVWSAVLAFYAIYGGGLLVLAVMPALKSESLGEAAAKGAALGLTAYATFDLTNLAIIRGWRLELALIDMAWGTFASAIAAAIGYAAGVRAKKRASARRSTATS